MPRHGHERTVRSATRYRGGHPKAIDRQGFLSAVTVLPETFQNAAKLEYILP
jgi:hypothetical protein